MQATIDFISANWPAISAILIIIIEQILPTTNVVKANSTSQLIINAVVGLFRKGGGPLLLVLILAGCIPACATVNLTPSLNCGEGNRNTVKTSDNDTPSTKVETTATIPLR